MSLIRRSNIFDPFSLDIWDPFEGFPSTISVPRSNAMSETSSFANARIDWKETPEAHVFKADLPGVRKEEVKIEVEDGRVLQISGERSREHEEKNDKWHSVERSSGKFMRRFRLPENANINHIKASMENGVLTVTVPKEEVKKPEVKSIDISGGDAAPTTITNGSAQAGEGREQASAAVPASHGVGEAAAPVSEAHTKEEQVAQETH